MKIIFFAMALCASIAQAQIIFHLEGIITNFDDKQVTIEIDGVPFEVPRAAFGKRDLRPGKRVSVGAGLATVLNVGERIAKAKPRPLPSEEK